MFPYATGSWALALRVLVASVMIPLGKLVVLAYLLIDHRPMSWTRRCSRVRSRVPPSELRCTVMLDVFVITFTVALVQLQPFMSVAPAPGVLFFTAVVVLTMMAAESFDQRLIWDPAVTRENRHG